MQAHEEENIVRLMKENFPLVEAIYLFGSNASNTNVKDSDVDVAFLTPFECSVNAMEVFQAKIQLEIALGKDVDLIHLNQMSTVFQFQVTTTGLHLFVKDANFVLRYETLMLSMYQRLQEERKGIVNEVISSGKVYA